MEERGDGIFVAKPTYTRVYMIPVRLARVSAEVLFLFTHLGLFSSIRTRTWEGYQ